MSKVHIKRTVENIRANTTVYTPIVEVIVNAIQAIESAGKTDGQINIRVLRSEQLEMDGGLPAVCSFIIEDNGVGFTDEHRNAFDTLYTDIKISEGGKGFGRFTCLKYFQDVDVSSIFADKDVIKLRNFSMGKIYDIIVNEKIYDTDVQITGTTITLTSIKNENLLEKKLATIARNLVERLLPYFITADYNCPRISIAEKDGSGSILLNDFYSNELSSVIKEVSVAEKDFLISGNNAQESFSVRVFKLFFPKNQKSKISLVAHKREVTTSAIQNYIPEFCEEFYEKDNNGKVITERNYIVKAYVFSDYLDRNVPLERSGFEFQAESDNLFDISQIAIESRSAAIAKEAVGGEITARQEKKKERVQNYVNDEAPWHKHILNKVDLSSMAFKASDEEIEGQLQREKFLQELQIKKEVGKILANDDPKKLKTKVSEVVKNISETSKNDLIHYIALRRNILDIFDKSLQIKNDNTYSSEGVVHDIIFPRKGNTEITNFEDHNLWIIDERLNFTTYVSSDTPLNGPNTERTDLAVYNKRIFLGAITNQAIPLLFLNSKNHTATTL